MGRPRRTYNLRPKKLTVALVERLRRGLSQVRVCDLTTTHIPVQTIREIEQGHRVPTPEDLAALGALYGYADPSVLLHEVVLPPAVQGDVAAREMA